MANMWAFAWMRAITVYTRYGEAEGVEYIGERSLGNIRARLFAGNVSD